MIDHIFYTGCVSFVSIQNLATLYMFTSEVFVSFHSHHYVVSTLNNVSVKCLFMINGYNI